ncbi:4892_t:CDS:2, partial [Ambispora leptoticha]
FGAEQVIIVRDEKSKSRVEDLIGKKGLVLTVFEAKGMEFNDVLLYNFFTDSPGGLKWRAILSGLGNQSGEVQTFSHEKHYILSSELKHLYVAVTRARQHIWIFDENDEYIEPICRYWERNGLVKVIWSEDEASSFPTLARTSSPAEWNREGDKFFELRKYKQAIFCYEKSENWEKIARAKAYHLRQKARASINDSDWDTVILNFYLAADAFRKCSRPIQEASCYEDINMYEKAAEIYLGECMFEHAARCYLKVPNFEYAGKYFEMANKYTEAVLAYKDGRYYEKVIDLMQSHREEIDERTFNRITRLVNIHYRRMNDMKMSKKALSILPTQEDQMNLLREHAPEELQEVCKKSGQFRLAAEDLRSRGEFNKAADMFLHSVDNDNDIMESLRCYLHLCRVKILNITMSNFVNQNSSEELKNGLFKAKSIITKVKSQSLKSSEEWEKLKEEVYLYQAYLNSDLDRIRKSMQFFNKIKDCVTEFRAVIIWLHIHVTRFDIRAENWQERLRCLLRICELTFPFLVPRKNANVNIEEINKNFQDIFVVSKDENCPHKRKISVDNHIAFFLNQNIMEDAVEVSDKWLVYDENILNSAISKLLASYIYEHIYEAGQKGKEIPDIDSEICSKFTSCFKHDCRKHHVIPTPSIIRKRFSLACLQYTVIRKLDALYHRRILKEEQSERVRQPQRYWAEKLVLFHIRYQSPQTSCPEVIYAVLAEQPKQTRYKLIEFAHKVWFPQVFTKLNDFSVMLKCMLVLYQLNDEWGINEFRWAMSRKKYPEESPVGFEYYMYQGYYKTTPVGKRLSLFFSCLYDNHVISAIKHIKIFTQYIIDKIDLVNINTSDAFGDLISLMEFKISLVFAISPGYCDFCLPRAYLVNYFDAFTAEPLNPNQDGYDEIGYLAELNDSIDQIQRLLDLLILTRQYYLITILRLMRLLILIGLKESSNFGTKIFNLFKNWAKPLKENVFSPKIIRYLNESYMMSRLALVLHNDLSETDCDSLVIVHYHGGGSSKFSYLEQHGIIKLEYKSVKQFYFALRQIMSPGVHRRNSEKSEISNKNQDSATEIQAWFRRIHDSLQAKESATKIQVWFRRALQRQESRQYKHDPILEQIFNEMVVFCKNELFWKSAVKNKGRKRVNKYHILLRGLIVKNIVDLIKLQGKMDATKIKLQKMINNRSSDDQKIDKCLELLDDLKYNHYENIKMVLDSLSISKNTIRHQEANIDWLKNESQIAEDFLNDVYHWVNRCNDAMKK